MAVQMTRAEYEAKYGTAPAVSSSSAPVQMTRAQYEAKYGVKPAATTTTPTFVSGLKEDFARRNTIVQKAKADAEAGKQSKVSGIFQSMGQAAGLIADVGLEGAKAVDRTVTGGKVGEMLMKGATKVAGTDLAQKAISGYGTFKAAHPEAAGNIEAAANIASVVPVGKVAQLGVKGATTAAKIAAEETAALASKAATKAATGAKAGISKGASVFTGVPQDVLERAASPERAALTERAIAHVSQNEKEPFLDIARRTANAINSQEEKAASTLGSAKEAFRQEFPNAAFNVAPKMSQIVAPLEKFRSSGLFVEQTKDGGFRVAKTVQSPFSTQEVAKINNLLHKMNSSTAVDADNLIALRQSFSTAYDDVPLGVNKQPRPYHAVIMSLKSAAEPAIEDLLPPDLRQAFKEYAILQDMKDDIGNKIINGDGTLKDGAEQYLANLANTNKGNVRMNAERFKQLTGLDLESEVQAVKDAQKLVSFFPSTGSRSQDIIRSLAVSGLGTFAGGPVGSALGLAATSPLVAGKAAVKLGKYLAKKGEKAADQARSPELSSPTPGLPPKTIQNNTKSTRPKNAGIVPPFVSQKHLPDYHPNEEPFPALLNNKALQVTIDKHMYNAQLQIDKIGRQAMRRKESMPHVLETAKTNIVKSLRDSDLHVFADLVDKFDVKPFTSLQAFKEAIMTYLRNAQPGLSMKNVGNVHPTDRQVMVDFIDAVRTGKVGGGTLTPAQRLKFETEARRAAPGYGINPDIAPGALANKFDQLLSRSAEKRGKNLGTYLMRDNGTLDRTKVTPATFRRLLNERDRISKGNEHGNIVDGHRERQYAQRQRLYGDYLFAQDREHFNALLQSYQSKDGNGYDWSDLDELIKSGAVK